MSINHDNEHQKTLMKLSVWLWWLSLFLPAFYDGATPFYGGLLLLFLPLAFFQFPAGLAVYANVFYWRIYRKINRGGNPILALALMLICAAMTFTFEEIEVDILLDLEADIWGYGAFIWGLSIILMAGAMLDKREFISKRATLAPYLIPFAVLMLILSGIKAYQWWPANKDERARYIPLFAAYGASFKPTGIPYNPPPRIPPHRYDAPLEVEGELVFDEDSFFLKAKEDYHLSLPIPFLYRGYLVSKIDERYVIRPSNEQAYYRYHVPYSSHDKVTLVLDNVRENREVWRSDSFFLKTYQRDLPHYVTEPYPDFKSKIAESFNQENKESSTRRESLTLPLPMRFDTRCPSKALPRIWQNFEHHKNLTVIDDLIVLFKRSSYQDRIGFNDVFWCHEDWVLTVDARSNTENPHEFVLSGEILNRSDLRHIIDEYDEEYYREYRKLYYILDYSKMPAEDVSALVDLHHRYGVHALELGLRAVDFDLTQLRLHFDFGEIVLKTDPLMMHEKDYTDEDDGKRQLEKLFSSPQHRPLIKARPYSP